MKRSFLALCFSALCLLPITSAPAQTVPKTRPLANIGCNLFRLGMDAPLAMQNAYYQTQWQKSDGSAGIMLDSVGYPTTDARLYMGAFNWKPGTWTVSFTGAGVFSYCTPSALTGSRTADGKGWAGTVSINLPAGAIGVSGNIWGWVTGTNPADPVRNFTILPPGADPTQTFTPELLASLKFASTIRFMDVQNTNLPAGPGGANDLSLAMTPVDVNNRALPTMQQVGPAGMCIEFQVALCNKLGADLWWNIPTNATAAYIDFVARYCAANLAPGLRVYLEYSNEVWNFGAFPQGWVVQAAAVNNPDITNQDKWQRVYQQVAWRLHQAVTVFDQYMDPARVYGVLAGQAVSPGWVQTGLDYLKSKGWLGCVRRLAYADYFGPADGWTATPTVDNYITSTHARLAGNVAWFTAYNAVASQYGIEGVCTYEGGLGINPTGNAAWDAVAVQAMYDPRVVAIYTQAVTQFNGVGPWMNYASVGPDRCWGMRRYFADKCPKYDALAALGAGPMAAIPPAAVPPTPLPPP